MVTYVKLNIIYSFVWFLGCYYKTFFFFWRSTNHHLELFRNYVIISTRYSIAVIVNS